MALIDILNGLALKGAIDVDDVRALETACDEARPLAKTEVETILAVDMVSGSICPEWTEFVKTEILDNVVSLGGSLRAEALAWLVETFSRNGIVNDHEKFELLLCVIEKLNVVPDSLSALLLAQIGKTILSEEGPLAHLKMDAIGVISKQDVALIRRVLIGAEGRDPTPVSKLEISFLLDLNEQTRPSANHPSWQDLLVKAMTSFVLGDNGAYAEKRSASLSPQDSENLDVKISLCVAHLRTVAHMIDGLKQHPGLKTSGRKEAPADWIINRFEKSGTFASDNAAMVDYVTQMAGGRRASQTTRAVAF